MFVSSAVDHEFQSQQGQTKDYKIGIYCFSAKHAAWEEIYSEHNVTEKKIILLLFSTCTNLICELDISNFTIEPVNFMCVNIEIMQLKWCEVYVVLLS